MGYVGILVWSGIERVKVSPHHSLVSSAADLRTNILREKPSVHRKRSSKWYRDMVSVIRWPDCGVVGVAMEEGLTLDSERVRV